MVITWLIQREERVVGHSGPLFFMTASKPASIEVLQQIEQHILSIGEKFGPVSFLMVIRPNSAERVTPEGRARLTQMLAKIAPSCLGHAMVIDAKGLFGTIVRTFLAGLALVTAGNS